MQWTRAVNDEWFDLWCVFMSGFFGETIETYRDKMDPAVTTFYNAAYPGDALSKLWWWPPQDAWFIKLRSEYADKWKAA